MSQHQKLVKTIYEYLDYHHFTLDEFCRLAHLDPAILDKIINKQHYVSFADYKKLAFILNIPISEVLTY